MVLIPGSSSSELNSHLENKSVVRSFVRSFVSPHHQARLDRDLGAHEGCKLSMSVGQASTKQQRRLHTTVVRSGHNYHLIASFVLGFLHESGDCRRF
jgi:hypothetical protein